MQSSSPATVTSSERREEYICYTPERLIRSQEYRILIPSPRRFAYTQRLALENEDGDAKYRRKRLSRLIDSKQIGT